MGDCLAALLSPVGPEAFFLNYRKREYLFVARNREDFYDSMVGVGDLDEYLQSELLPASSINIVRDGVRCPLDAWSTTTTLPRGSDRYAAPEKIFSLYGSGATVILNAVDHTVPPVTRVCRELARELGHPVQANIYITPPHGQGFANHRDEHDVLVLQIHGRKCWRIFPDAQDGAGTAPAVDLEMRQGDLLYIPRGTAHEAKCSDVASIHVTVGLLPIYAFHLIEELAASARDHPLFQDPVPLAVEGSPARQEFEAEFTRRLEAMLTGTPVATLVGRRMRHIVDNQPRGWPGRLVDVLGVREITGDSVLCARPTIIRSIEDSGNSLDVHFAGNKITVPGFLRGCVDRMLGNTPFTVGDLEGLLTTEGKVELVRPFVTYGLLSIVRV